MAEDKAEKEYQKAEKAITRFRLANEALEAVKACLRYFKTDKELEVLRKAEAHLTGLVEKCDRKLRQWK